MTCHNGIIRYDISDLDTIPERKKDANKGSYGHVLIVAGSYGMSGAAYLSALAAYRTGAGLVQIFTSEENREILQILLPEAIVSTYTPEEVTSESAEWKERITALLHWADAVVIGPGIGKKDYVRLLMEDILDTAYVPLIIDADALNAISEYPYLTNYYTENIIITPHVGEMSRLTGKPVPDIAAELSETAAAYRDMYGITCLLKSDHSITASNDGKLYETVSGTPALAKAGSGDVLTGIIAGLICLGYDTGQAAAFASFIHGLAGRSAARSLSEHGILARDVANAVPDVMRRT